MKTNSSKIASKEMFCYARNFFLTIRSGFTGFLLGRKKVLC